MAALFVMLVAITSVTENMQAVTPTDIKTSCNKSDAMPAY